jgi:hypothetical protein
MSFSIRRMMSDWTFIWKNSTKYWDTLRKLSWYNAWMITANLNIEICGLKPSKIKLLMLV